MTISKLLPNWWKCETMSPPFSIKGKYNTSNGDYSAKSWSIFKKSPISGILIHWTIRSLYWKLNLVKVEGRYGGFYESYESAELFQPWLYLYEFSCWLVATTMPQSPGGALLVISPVGRSHIPFGPRDQQNILNSIGEPSTQSFKFLISK